MVKKHKRKKNNSLWKISTYTFALLFVIAIFTGGFTSLPFQANTTAGGDDVVVSDSFTVTVLNDDRCVDCAEITAAVVSQLKTIFPDVEVEELDYSTKEGKKLYDDNDVVNLPTFLFDEQIEQQENYAQIQNYLIPQGDYRSLQVGATFDPSSEICDNGIDDTGDGLIDCEAEECQAQWQCVQKSDKPVVELFIMSHCPYGTQMEKGMIPVVKTLGDKIDFQLKFVNYAMHGETEVYEQLNQYCIDKEYPEQLIPYLECFLEEGDGEACLGDMDIADCVAEADEKFSLTANLEDESTWMGQFPPFNIYAEDNVKYGIRGSPSLRINGAEPTAGRDSASLLEAICYAFDDAPEECETELSSTPPSAGFGYDEGTATTATC